MAWGRLRPRSLFRGARYDTGVSGQHGRGERRGLYGLPRGARARGQGSRAVEMRPCVLKPLEILLLIMFFSFFLLAFVGRAGPLDVC